MAFDNSKTYTGGTAADDAGTVNFFNSFRFQYGTAGNRPAAGNQGVLYFATDTFQLSYDTGAAWVDFSALDYTQIAATDISPAKDNAWHDANASAVVPAGIRLAMMVFKCPDTDNNAVTVGIRPNGSALTNTWTMGDAAVGNTANLPFPVKLDTNRICDALIGDADGTLYVIGYWR